MAWVQKVFHVGDMARHKQCPAKPQKIDIESLVFKEFGFDYSFEELGDPLGVARFNEAGIYAIEIHRNLDDLSNLEIDKTCRTTIAHEVGHGLVHSEIYAEAIRTWQAGTLQAEIWSEAARHDPNSPPLVAPPPTPRWMEEQAEAVAAELLLPRRLVKSFCFADWGFNPARHGEDNAALARLAQDLSDFFVVELRPCAERVWQLACARRGR